MPRAPDFPAHIRPLEVPVGPGDPVRVQATPRAADRRPHFDVHNACEVGVVTKGRYRRFYEDLTRDVPAGQVWLCGVWEPHGAQTLDTPTRSVQFLFGLEWLLGEGVRSAPWGRLFLDSAPRNRGILLDRDESRLVVAAAERARSEYTGSRPWRVESIVLSLKQILLPLLRKSAPADAAGDRDTARVEKVIRTVDAQLPRPLSLQDAARAAHLSRSRFSDVFKRATGVSFGEFVQRARAARAAQDIATSDVKIAAVARRWNYVDQSHLHRVFRKLFRCTPAEYRRRSRER